MDEEDFLNAGNNAFDSVDFGDEEEEPPPPPTDHVVHVYEFGKLRRTIDRLFTAEDAEAFASEYNRTAKPYGRFAVAGKEKGRPKKTIELRLKYMPGGVPVIHGIQRVSRPGRRVYAGANGLPKVLNGLGVSIVSTSQGVMSGDEARSRRIGGEVLCQVW